MTLLILFFVLSISFSFLCSILEAVLLSITPSFLRQQKEHNPGLHSTLTKFKKDIDRPLSAILTLNTIAHTIGAIGVGASAGELFGSTQWSFFGLSLTAESIVATVMTLAILILSEIIPKTIGANNWKALTPFTVATINILLRVLAPLVWLSQRITKGLKNEKGKSVLTRADIWAMADEVSKEGELKAAETSVIQNVLKLPHKTIHDIMTPRTVMYTAIETETLDELIHEDDFNQFSRIPLYDDEKENITGVVLKSEVLRMIVDGRKDELLKSIAREVSFVQEDEPLSNFFNRKFDHKAHLYIVKDTYGSVTGLVTMEDVLETVLGYEIVDETDKIADLQKLANKN